MLAYDHIAPVPPELTELDIVSVGAMARLENCDKFVLGAIETAHARRALHPNRDIFELAVHALRGGKQLADMTPIDEQKM